MVVPISQTAHILHGLKNAVYDLERVVDPLKEDIRQAIERDYFKPDEDERLWYWFSRYLSVREELWQIIDVVSNNLGALALVISDDDWRQFILGFCAATLLVRIDHLFIDEIATHSLAQRKFNEANPVYRIPRKQYTRVFKALTDPDNSLLILQALRFSQVHRKKLRQLASDPEVGIFARELPSLEQSIDPGVLRYVFRLLRYRWHAFRRRGASAKQQSAFLLLEAGGRMVAEISNQHIGKRVRPVIEQIKSLLKPGDIFVTRHDFAASNLFLPGFWPHAALYIGTQADREAMGVIINEAQASRWRNDKCVLEADKNGVLFRSLQQTLSVDAMVIIRPLCSEQQIAQAISRACRHEGKDYKFDFDFTRSDKLVCTEVIYRAFDGIGNIHFSLKERAGRYALSAEDLLDLALDETSFKPVALFGTPGCEQSLCVGENINTLLANSYRQTARQ